MVGTLVVVSCLGRGNPKSDCLKALQEAKQAGLPITGDELVRGKITPESRQIDALLSKARAISHRYRPSLAETIEETRRKKLGQPSLIQKQSAAAKESVERDVLAVIDEIGRHPGLPSPSNPGKTSLLSLGHEPAYLATPLIRMELDHAKNEYMTPSKVVTRFRLAHRLLDFCSVDENFIGAMKQLAWEKNYYSTLTRICKNHPALIKSIPKDLLAPPRRSSVNDMLRAEFIQEIRIWFEGDHELGKQKRGTPTWSLPTDDKALVQLTKLVKNWTYAYKELRNCRSNSELEAKYRKIVPKLETVKYENEEWKLGPNYAGEATVLDRAEKARLDMIRQLGLAK